VRGIGLTLSAFAFVIVLVVTVWALAVAASEWWPLILIYAGLYMGGALAVIWLGVFVIHVIVKGVRLMNEGKP
jgi:hypothetical protein